MAFQLPIGACPKSARTWSKLDWALLGPSQGLEPLVKFPSWVTDTLGSNVSHPVLLAGQTRTWGPAIPLGLWLFPAEALKAILHQELLPQRGAGPELSKGTLLPPQP